MAMSKYNIDIELMPARALGITYPISIVNGKVGRPVTHANHSRYVYFHGPIVVKIDQEHFLHQPSSESQCYKENIFWRSVRERDHARFFAPVLQYGIAGGYRYIVQPRIKFDHKADKSRHYDTLQRLMSRFSLTDISFMGDTGDNWAISKEGNLVIYDYGFCIPDKPQWPEFKAVV